MARAEAGRRLSDIDALLWRIETDPLLRSTVIMVSVLDRFPDRDRLIDRVQRSTEMITRLRQRVVESPVTGVPRWEDDPHFDLAYHLRFLRAPGGGTLRDVLDMAIPNGMSGFDRSRPLWETYMIEGMADGKAGMIQKIHHALTDGIGGMEMALSTLDLERDPEKELTVADLGVEPDAPNTTDRERAVVRAARGVARAVRQPRQSAAKANEVVASLRRSTAAAPIPLSPLMAKRSASAHYDTISVPLKQLKSAAKSNGATLNEAFVSAVLGGLRAYHAHHGVDVSELRMTLPVSTRDVSGEADLNANTNNQFIPTRFSVPMTVADPVERMRVVRERLASELAEPILAYADAVASLLNRMPTRSVTKLFGSTLKGVDFIASNVPGPPVYLYLAGAKIESQFPFGPLASAAVNVTLLSGPEEVHVGVNTDPAAVPDPDVLVDCLQQGFDEILKFA